MPKLLFVLSASAAVFGSLAVAACVGDDPSPAASGTVAQGVLGGPCFANGTCNVGLSCSSVDGTTKCVSSSSTPTPTSDASTVDPPITGTDSGPVGPGVCIFQPTPYPCTGQQPTACYSGVQTCSVTGCGEDMLWQCNSPNQCNDGACCVPPDIATLAPGAACTPGTLQITPDVPTGAICPGTATCAADQIQLCQADVQCAKGKRCAPVKIIGVTEPFLGTVLGACIP